jgi:hypothetical protein
MFNIPFPIKILILLVIVAAAAGMGYVKGSSYAEVQLTNYKASAEKQISSLKTENANITSKVITQYVDRVNTIREKETIYKTATENLGAQHDLSTGWVELHDASARLANPDATLASDKSPSGVMDNSALAVVISNYRICYEDKNQLSSLQKWIIDNQAAIEKANKERPKDNEK